ncbi:1,2-phenylacetyl-CoA epoxidase subunit PaaC [Flexivirga oryzae]|uniref:Ring-1,2-phenylacetyl-CoA epoxidase subunit PaaC n=1 Tax=Flexivirga oryzae TaxID=1794944 RepID=A0A839NFU8_9MICO|nr:1,2-phenylacetyl-CoA epoxidase subunit PaaC [Flexivirga oryzae]MBB2894015.1 ring-1,2-phenylacetyl-CoA epoxidase subunit PaaC [Flexivirga oryzae]
MSEHITQDAEGEHDNAYAGLLGNDAHWAFGTDFEDPLAGVDTTIPEGVDAAELAQYCLMLGDDALIYAHRLSEWTSNAPDLEEDIAIANIALDLVGQARLLLARAAAADPSLVPSLPEGSPVPDEDRLAYFRDAGEFRNVRLAEVPNGDFAELVTRLLVLSTWRLATLQRLVDHPDAVLAAIAAKGVKELAYHRDFAGRWFVTLAGGTEESHRRLTAAMATVWPLIPELETGTAVERAVGVDPASVAPEIAVVLDQVLATAGMATPDAPALAGVQGRTGRDGMHSEALSRLLAEMQVVARAHPMGRW